MSKKSLIILTLLMLFFLRDLGVANAETNYALGKPFYTTIDNTLKQEILTDSKTYTSPYYGLAGTGSPIAVTIDLKGVYDINKIKVWHYWADSRTYYGTKTEVSEDGQSWYAVFDSSINGAYQETQYGQTHWFPVRKVRYIRDWLNGSTANPANHWVEIQAFGPGNSTVNVQNSGWSWSGESIAGLSGRFSGNVSLSTDKAAGKYSVQVTTKDDPYDWAHYGFSDTFKSLDTDIYSQISIWVKPGPNGKVLRFWVRDDLENRYEQITSDKNNDGLFKVGEDLESGQWNKITLNLKQTDLGGVAKNASDLQLLTNEYSTWYWDEAKTIYSPVFKLNIANMPNNFTQLVNGSVRYKLDKVSSITNSLSWNFNQNNNYEGWSMTSSVNGSVTGGVLNLTSSTGDPYIHSPSISINAAANRYIKIRMKNSTASQQAQIYWLTNGDGNWNDSKSRGFPINPNSDYTDYVVDVGSNSFWRNTITQLRFDPGTTTGVFNVDYINIQSQSEAAYSTNPTVLATSTDPTTFPNGRIEKISINSNYIDTSGSPAQLQNSNKLVAANTSKIIVSGDGNKVFYLNSGDHNKLYLFDKATQVNRKLLDYTDIVEMKTGFLGGVLFFTRFDGSNNTLWYYDIRDNSTKLMANVIDPVKFTTLNEAWNVLYYSNVNGNPYITVQDIRGGIWHWVPLYGFTNLTGSDPHWFYSFNQGNNGVIKRLSWIPNVWKETEIVSSPKLVNINQLLANKDASFLFIRIGSTLYSLDVKNKVLKQLNAENVGNLIKISDDNRVFYTDTYGDFMVYDSSSDNSLRIRPDNTGNMTFAVDNSGSMMFYDAPGGIYISDLTNNIKPDKYLLSFDGRQSWASFKAGKWQKFNNNWDTTIRTYGMTADEVNELDSVDFAQLYQDGQEVYSVDIAMLFQTPSSAISPQLNGITVTMSGEEASGVSLLYPQQQVDYNSSNWRTIKRIYPIELQPKQADVFYFLSTDGGTTLKAYKNGRWNTYQTTLLSQPSQNWEIIMQVGMAKEELKAVPTDQLSSLLPVDNFSVVYVTKVDDSSTDGYSSKITVDYVENLYTTNKLVLKITTTNGTIKEYPNLTKHQIEEFMTWLKERQYNRGPIYYLIKTNGLTPGVIQTNRYINYYLIEAVDVDELS